jgi:hypothetical protein
MILATCSLEEAREFHGKISSGSEKVFLNIRSGIEGLLDVFRDASGNRSVYCVTVSGWNGETELPEVPEVLIDKVYVEEELEKVVDVPNGYIPYVVLPSGYSNMRDVLNLCTKHEKVRVTGGNLLEIPGVRIGRTDTGKEKMSSAFCGVYDAFLEMDIRDIDNLEVIKSRIRKSDLDAISGTDVVKEKKPKSAKSSGTKTSKVLESSFSNLFSGEEVDF